MFTSVIVRDLKKLSQVYGTDFLSIFASNEPMPKIAYIILAHNNPAQLYRLLKAIEAENCTIFLHIDKKADLTLFTKVEGLTKIKNLVFLPRFKSYWGGVGLVRASLAGVQHSIEHNCDYTILLSGADYPLKSNSEINRFLEDANGKSFLTYYQMPAPHWLPGKEITRIQKYYFRFKNTLFEYPMHPEMRGVARRMLNFILRFFLKNQRVFPKGIVPFGGDQWFCLNRNACEAVVTFNNDNPALLKFLKHALISDEIFFQTALLNSTNETLIKSIVNETTTYINWKNKNDPSPVLLAPEDYNALINSQKLFARKFDLQKHPQLLDQIDKSRTEA